MGSAEAIAKVVKNLREGKFLPAVGQKTDAWQRLVEEVPGWAEDASVIDISSIYKTQVVGKSYQLYEDHPCVLPPWLTSLFAYENAFGNVQVLLSVGAHYPDGVTEEVSKWETAEPIDWGDVAWTSDHLLFLGGMTAKGPIETQGPLFCWQIAMDKIGTPLDIHWVDLSPAVDIDDPERSTTDIWTPALVATLRTLNFLNCRNIDIIEPKRERHERKRIERLGVRIYNINVFPIGKSYRSKGERTNIGVPLTSVRGHFAHYGPEYGRALLFGKYSGRFWIPQHARGSEEHGRSEHDYTLREL